MSKNLWLPFGINIVLLLCAIPTVMMLPEIRNSTLSTQSGRNEEASEEAGPLLGDDQDASSHQYANAFDARPNQSVADAIRKMVRLINGRRNFQILLCSFFLTALASSDTKLLVQYISKRYEWTFAQVG